MDFETNLDTVIVIESCCGDIIGAMGFNSDYYDRREALNMFTDRHISFDEDDTIRFVSENNDEDTYELALNYIGTDLLSKATEYALRSGSFVREAY